VWQRSKDPFLTYEEDYKSFMDAIEEARRTLTEVALTVGVGEG